MGKWFDTTLGCPSGHDITVALEDARRIRDILGGSSLNVRGFAMAQASEVLIALLERELRERDIEQKVKAA